MVGNCRKLGAPKVFYIAADMASPEVPERVVQFALDKLGEGRGLEGKAGEGRGLVETAREGLAGDKRRGGGSPRLQTNPDLGWGAASRTQRTAQPGPSLRRARYACCGRTRPPFRLGERQPSPIPPPAPPSLRHSGSRAQLDTTPVQEPGKGKLPALVTREACCPQVGVVSRAKTPTLNPAVSAGRP